jgi:hypothetical protein
MALCAAGPLGLVATPAFANWTSLPGAIQLDANPAYARVRTASDGSGGMYVAWRESIGPGVNNPMYLQHMNGLGNYIWGFAKKINDGGYPAGKGDYMQMDICPDGSGGVFVAYEDYFSDLSASGTRTWLTRLDFSGATMPGFPVQLNLADGVTSAAERPAVSSDGAGNAFVSWADQRFVTNPGCSLPGWQLLAQKVDATGHRLWNIGGSPVSAAGDLATDLDNEPAMRAAPSGGGAYFTWTAFDIDCSPSVIRIQYLDSSGAPKISPFFVGAPISTGSPSVAYPSPSGSACVVTIFREAHEALIESIATNGFTFWRDTLDVQGLAGSTSSDDAGGVLVTWQNWSASGQFVQDVGVNGSFGLPFFSANTRGTRVAAASFCASSLAFPPSIVPDHKGGAIVAATGDGPIPGQRQVRAQGVSYSARPAFPAAGLTVSPSAQNATAISGVPGVLNTGMFAWGNANGAWIQQISLSDLDVTVTPPGWAGPLVPRWSNDATLSSVTSTPLADDLPTYFNWAVTHHGPNPTPDFWSVIFLDGFSHLSVDIPDGAGPGLYHPQNIYSPPFKIPGGPHTLTLYSDWSSQGYSVDESSEGDNVWSGQFTWRPSFAYVGPSLDSPAGPLGHFPLHNGNSHKFHVPGPLTPAGAPNAWVVSDAARRGPTFGGPTGGVIGYGDSYGFELYDAPAGVPEFTHMVDASHQPFNGTNFILGLGSAVPESLYTLQVRDSTQDTNPDSCWFDFQQADGRAGPIGTSWTNQAMAAGELADVYVLNAVVRQPMRLTLRKQERNPGPTGRLAFELFAPGSAATFHRGSGFGSLTHDADAETLTVVATRTGSYLAVVYRTDGSNAGTPLTYDFMTSSTQTLDAPVAPRVLALRGATPNPASAARMTIAFELPSDAPARLEVVDVGGRRVLSRDVGGMGVGPHAVDLANGSRIAPGVYWVRLTQGATSRMARVAVVD